MFEQPDYRELGIQALSELQGEIKEARRGSLDIRPQLLKYHISPGGICVGLRDCDNAPMGPSVYESSTGSWVALGSEADSTGLLQCAAQSIIRFQDPNHMQYAVITQNPKDWQNFARSPHNAGIFSVYMNSASEFILSLAEWAARGYHPKQHSVLFVDNLAGIANLNAEIRDTFLYLVNHGPRLHVPVIAGLDTSSLVYGSDQYRRVNQLLPHFATRLDSVGKWRYMMPDGNSITVAR